MPTLQRPVSCVNIVIIIPARNVNFSIEYLFLNLCMRKRLLCHVTDIQYASIFISNSLPGILSFAKRFQYGCC